MSFRRPSHFVAVLRAIVKRSGLPSFSLAPVAHLLGRHPVLRARFFQRLRYVLMFPSQAFRLLLTLASVLGTRRLFDSSLERAGNFRLFQNDRPSRYHALHGHIWRTFLEQAYCAREMFPDGRLHSPQAAPLLLAPLSEVYGRSYIYFVSAVVFFLCFLPQALAKSIVLVLVFRFISGIAGSTAVSLVGGTLADVWRDEDRGTPMALFSFAAFGCTFLRFSRTFREQRLTFRECTATGLGPVAFGYLAQYRGFRYVSWALFAMSGAFAIFMPFVLDETRASVLLSRKAAKLRKTTGDDRYQSKDEFERASLAEMFKTSLSRPVRMLLTEPVLLAITLWISFSWAVLCELCLEPTIPMCALFADIASWAQISSLSRFRMFMAASFTSASASPGLCTLRNFSVPASEWVSHAACLRVVLPSSLLTRWARLQLTISTAAAFIAATWPSAARKPACILPVRYTVPFLAP